MRAVAEAAGELFGLGRPVHRGPVVQRSGCRLREQFVVARRAIVFEALGVGGMVIGDIPRFGLEGQLFRSLLSCAMMGKSEITIRNNR